MKKKTHLTFTNQERGEDSKESTKTKNDRVTNSLIKHWFAFKETGLPHAHTSILRHMIVLARKFKW